MTPLLQPLPPDQIPLIQVGRAPIDEPSLPTIADHQILGNLVDLLVVVVVANTHQLGMMDRLQSSPKH